MVRAVIPLRPLSMARGCARIDSRLDTAKIGSAGRVEVYRTQLLAVIGVRKTFPHGLDPTRTSRGWLASLEIRCPRSFRVLICPCVRLSQRLPCVALRGPCLTQGSLAWIAQGNVFA